MKIPKRTRTGDHERDERLVNPCTHCAPKTSGGKTVTASTA